MRHHPQRQSHPCPSSGPAAAGRYPCAAASSTALPPPDSHSHRPSILEQGTVDLGLIRDQGSSVSRSWPCFSLLRRIHLLRLCSGYAACRLTGYRPGFPIRYVHLCWQNTRLRATFLPFPVFSDERTFPGCIKCDPMCVSESKPFVVTALPVENAVAARRGNRSFISADDAQAAGRISKKGLLRETRSSPQNYSWGHQQYRTSHQLATICSTRSPAAMQLCKLRSACSGERRALPFPVQAVPVQPSHGAASTSAVSGCCRCFPRAVHGGCKQPRLCGRRLRRFSARAGLFQLPPAHRRLPALHYRV